MKRTGTFLIRISQKSISTISIILFLVATGHISGQVLWEKYENNPVIDVGVPGSWDCRVSGPTSVIYHDGIHKAWLYGVDDSDRGQIGYATSADGLEWNKHENNPVLSPGNQGDWDDTNTDHACVLIIDGTYRMWYMGENDSSARIGYATSDDGIHWEKYSGNPILNLGPAGSWDENEVMHPSVLFDGSTFHMWYNGYGNDVQRTGYATSPDGITWTKYAGNPVLSPGNPDSWDGYMLAIMSVIQLDGEYKMWYTGGDGTDGDARYFRIGYATSPDGINWSKHEGNPVLDIGEAGSWDGLGVVPSTVLYDDTSGIYRMWYGGLDGVYGRTGYAVSEAVTGLNDRTGQGAYDQNNLIQIHPNPFHLYTTITYFIPESRHVKLLILDPSGRQVKLINEGFQHKGTYSVPFAADDLSSGIYYCTLQLDGIKLMSHKMVLVTN